MKKEIYQSPMFKETIEIEIEYDKQDHDFIVSCAEFDEYGCGITEKLAKKDMVISILEFHEYVKEAEDKILSDDFIKMRDRLKEIIV